MFGAPDTAEPPAGRDSMGTGGCIVEAPVETITFCTGDDKERRGKVYIHAIYT